MTGGNAAPVAADAAAPVVAALAAALDRVSALHDAVIADEPDAVHQARVLVRRMRSELAAFRELFDRAAVDRLRAKLAVLGDELGRVRDLEVRAAQAERHLAAVSPVAAAQRMRTRLVDVARIEHDAAHAELVEVLAAGDVLALRSALGEFIVSAPVAHGIDGLTTRARLAVLLDAEARRVWRAGEAAGRDLESLHRLRRAARRLRYAADAVSVGPSAVFGDEVRGVAVAAEAVQNLLGEHRDARLFVDEVGAVAVEAGADTRLRAGYTTIARVAEHEAAERLSGLPAAMRELRRRARVLATLH